MDKPKMPRGAGLVFIHEAVQSHADQCIIWPYGLYANGYGGLWIDRSRKEYAHRLSCELTHGTCPEGFEAAHSCGVRLCINPRHLRWATRKENMADKVIHGTQPFGESCHCTKLSEENVAEIRRLHQVGHYNYSELAAMFRTTDASIGVIIRGEVWKRQISTEYKPVLGMPRGERHFRAKLSEVDVIDIRKSASEGEGIQQIADRYGVTYTTINGILLRKTWAHVKDGQVYKPRSTAGEGNGRAKLRFEDVLYIRERLAGGSCTVEQLASMFGVSKCTVRSIARGNTWRAVTSVVMQDLKS